MTDTIKACACGAEYSPLAWKSLRRIGYMPSEDDTGNPVRLELRNCRACGSTLTIIAAKQRHKPRCSGWTIAPELKAWVREEAKRRGLTQSRLVAIAIAMARQASEDNS